MVKNTRVKIPGVKDVGTMGNFFLVLELGRVRVYFKIKRAIQCIFTCVYTCVF